MSNGYPSTESSFAAMLRARRRAAGLTQEELAERAHLSVRTVSGLESDARHTPYRETVRLLIAALELPAPEAATLMDAARGQTATDHAPDSVVRMAPAELRPLPIPPTALIGREREVAAARGLLAGDTRLLTLRGPAGVGKTRLALAVAASLGAAIEAAVFVDLAPARDPAHVLPAIAQALAVKEQSGQRLGDLIAQRVCERAILLLLDNFEQVVEAAPVVAVMLAACPGLKALVTSRETLAVRGERVFPVEPLSMPTAATPPSLEELSATPAVRLFVERARQACPDFALTPENGAIVAAICRRLDGLPLAIELAAPRVTLLPLAALLDRLEDRFALLSGGARDLPDRQQTLRGALDWSYDLLNPTEQALFRRMSVFAGGARVEDAEAIAIWVSSPPDPLSLRGEGEPDAGGHVAGSPSPREGKGLGDEDAQPLDLLMALVEKSLLVRERRPDGATRLRMLETLREYAWERLVALDEADDARRWQTRHYLRRAEAMERLPYPACATERAHFDDELDNVRAALRWALASPHAADGELGLGLAAELGQFWYAAGHISEGSVFLRGLLTRMERDHRRGATAIHAKAQHMAGWLALDQGECARAVERLSQSVALYRRTDDDIGLANALNRLGDATLQAGDHEAARRAFTESLDLRRRAGDELAAAGSLNNLGAVAMQAGDDGEAEARFTEALAIYRRHDDTWGVSFLYGNLGELARRRGDLTRAAQLYDDALISARERGDSADEAFLLGGLAEVAQARGDLEWSASLWRESLAIQRRLGNRYAIATCEMSLGNLARESGDWAEALALYGESLRAFHRLDVTKGVALCVTGVAEVARVCGAVELAARLCGGVATLRETLGLRPPSESRLHEQTTAAVRATLGERRFRAAWDAGRAAARDEGAGFALDAPARLREVASFPPPLPPAEGRGAGGDPSGSRFPLAPQGEGVRG